MTWGDDGAAIIWDTATGAVSRRLRLTGPVLSVTISRSGARLVTCCGDGVCLLWRTRGGGRPVTLATFGGHGAEFLPGRRVLVWGFEWATVRGKEGDLVCALRGHGRAIAVARAFPGGDRLITTGIDRLASLWDAASCERLVDLATDATVVDVAMLQGGASVGVLTSTGRVSVLNATSGEHIFLLDDTGPSFDAVDGVKRIAALPPGDLLATVRTEEVVIWSAASGEVAQRFGAGLGEISGALVPLLGDVMVVCGGRTARVWDPRTGALLDTLSEAPAEEGGCRVAVGAGRALDPFGFGHGVWWRELFGSAAQGRDDF